MNNNQSLYLLWATILNQSQSAETVLENTFELFKRLNLLSDFDKEYKTLDYEKIEKNMATKPCLHRFPRNMWIYGIVFVWLMKSTKVVQKNYLQILMK